MMPALRETNGSKSSVRSVSRPQVDVDTVSERDSSCLANLGPRQRPGLSDAASVQVVELAS